MFSVNRKPPGTNGRIVESRRIRLANNGWWANKRGGTTSAYRTTPLIKTVDAIHLFSLNTLIDSRAQFLSP